MLFRRKVPQEAEFQRLIERWAVFVRKTLVGIDPSRSEADLEELEQDVRLRLWQTLSRERNWDKPASFIRSVAMSVAIDAARRRQVRGGSHEHVGLEYLEPGDHGGDAPGAMVAERRAELLALLGSMQNDDPERAQAVGLYLQGFTTAEIGTLLGWTEAKARNLVYRSLDALRNRLSEEDGGGSRHESS